MQVLYVNFTRRINFFKTREYLLACTQSIATKTTNPVNILSPVTSIETQLHKSKAPSHHIATALYLSAPTPHLNSSTAPIPTSITSVQNEPSMIAHHTAPASHV